MAGALVTEAFVLRAARQGDTSLLVHALTPQHGLISLLVKGASGKRSRNPASRFRQLALLEITVARFRTEELNVLGDSRLVEWFPEIAENPTRSAVAQFIQEFVYKLVRHETPDESLYSFLRSVPQSLTLVRKPENFHLTFLMAITRNLGISPRIDPTETQKPYFDLRSGESVPLRPVHSAYLEGESLLAFAEVAESGNLVSGDKWRLNRTARTVLLEALLEYFRFHLPELGALRSVAVLAELGA